MLKDIVIVIAFIAMIGLVIWNIRCNENDWDDDLP